MLPENFTSVLLGDESSKVDSLLKVIVVRILKKMILQKVM